MTEKGSDAKFETALAADGFAVAMKSMDPSMVVDDHTHDFEVRGLVTEGHFNITVGGQTTRYAAGDRFEMAAGCVHSEEIGPDGVTFVVGRRDP